MPALYPVSESPARRSASAGCRYWSTGRTGDRIFQPSNDRLGMYRPGNRLCGGPGWQRRRNGYHRRKMLQTWCTGTCAARVCGPSRNISTRQRKGRPSGRVKTSSIPAKPIPCVPVHRAEVLPCADPGVTPKAAQRDQRHPYRYGQLTHLLRLANRRSGRFQNRRKCCSFARPTSSSPASASLPSN